MQIFFHWRIFWKYVILCSMKWTNIRGLILLCCLLFFVPRITHTLPVRNITSATLDAYSYEEVGLKLENVTIVRPFQRVSFLGKVNSTIRSDWWSLRGTLGCVYGLGQSTYAESSYGLEYVSDGTFVHHGLTDFYLEIPKFLFIAGIKGQFAVNQTTIIPSVAVKYYFFPFFGLWGKYMFIYDTVTGIDNSGWVEADFIVSPVLTFKVGGTASSYHTETAPYDQHLELGVLAGLIVSPAEIISIRYQFSFTDRYEYHYFSNLLLIDLKFL